MEGSSHFPFFPEIPCQPPLPVASVGLQHSPVVGQRWTGGVACVQGWLVRRWVKWGLVGSATLLWVF